MAYARFGLTEREVQIVEAVVAGEANKEIGLRLKISDETVKRHISNIFDKLNVSSRTQIAVRWMKALAEENAPKFDHAGYAKTKEELARVTAERDEALGELLSFRKLYEFKQRQLERLIAE